MHSKHWPTRARVLMGVFVVASVSICFTAARAQPAGGTVVSFTTQDASGNSLSLSGRLWLPPGPAKGAVVLVHSSGGWADYREGHYGRALSGAGYAALAFDAFGPRRITQTVEDQAQISGLQMTRDAFSARRFLLERGFPADRMAVMGGSKGGTVALYAADRNYLPEQADRFPVSIAIYPGCTSRPRVPRPVGAVFMALAERDDYSGVKPCQDIADAFRKAGGRISVKLYAGVGHAFDGNPDNTGLIRLRFAENFMNCVVFVEEDGRSSYAGKRFAPDDLTIVEEMRKSCVRKGASVWTDMRQKEAATRDVIAFLNDSFAK